MPAPVSEALDVLIDAGHEAVLVGGCVRDLVRGERPGDWDVATAADPERTLELFAGSSLENRFGTVTVRRNGVVLQVTPFRSEGTYADHRRPDVVRFGAGLLQDLQRRDFTINAMAWSPTGRGDATDGGVARDGELIDSHGGRDDLRAGILRAVGDPDRRLSEDALRLLRAVRFAFRLGLRLESATREAIARRAADARLLSGERVRDELGRILGSREPPPSVAFALMEELRLLGELLPEVAALRGVLQAKALPGDALDHSLRTMDALPADDPVLRLAGLLHDLGKPQTLVEDRFVGHEVVGADLARGILERFRYSRAEIERVTHLVRHHMFAYAPDWTDAAVRRFVRRVGSDQLADLFALRRADNAASGVAEPPRGGLSELERRIDVAMRDAAVETRQLAIDGKVLMDELGLEAGPRIGRLLHRLLDVVMEDPTRNRRDELLAIAREDLSASGRLAPSTEAGEPTK
ncbi:MAG: CCA tRNA nucleotidyltransferase [Candidatus Limnocylindria bacterium]